MARTQRILRVGIVQCAAGDNPKTNRQRVASFAMQAADAGAQLIVLPELPATRYFPQQRDAKAFIHAHTVADDPLISIMRDIAKSHDVVIPVSFFEHDPATDAYYNSVAVIDVGGKLLGIYRKSHIPENPGYHERFYFAEGDTGLRVWRTKHCRLGVGICWDQWFPETYRCMSEILPANIGRGAELFVFPTTIGSEPGKPALDTRARWRTIQLGQAAANVTPVAAANRVGVEGKMRFYGDSFVSNEAGEVIASMDEGEGWRVATLDLAAIARRRADWRKCMKRRPDLYGVLVR